MRPLEVISSDPLPESDLHSYLRLLRAEFHPVLKVSREGDFTAPLGTSFQVSGYHHRGFFPVFPVVLCRVAGCLSPLCFLLCTSERNHAPFSSREILQDPASSSLNRSTPALLKPMFSSLALVFLTLLRLLKSTVFLHF